MLFVYGTLKSGEPNFTVLHDRRNGQARFVSRARTKDRFPLVIASNYNVPFLLEKRGIGFHVAGEVYLVDDAMLETLDEFESHPMLYRRREVMVRLENSFRKDSRFRPNDDSEDSEGSEDREDSEDCDDDDVEDEEELVFAWCYLLPRFRPRLLHLELLENYSSAGSHGMKYAEIDDGDYEREVLEDE